MQEEAKYLSPTHVVLCDNPEKTIPINHFRGIKRIPLQQQQLLKTKKCPHIQSPQGCIRYRHTNSCPYAHNDEELRAPPNLRKTKVCPRFLRDSCPLRSSACPYAHGRQELRATEGCYKRGICKYWKHGRCQDSLNCRHAHGWKEVRGSVETPASTNTLPEAYDSLTTDETEGCESIRRYSSSAGLDDGSVASGTQPRTYEETFGLQSTSMAPVKRDYQNNLWNENSEDLKLSDSLCEIGNPRAGCKPKALIQGHGITEENCRMESNADEISVGIVSDQHSFGHREMFVLSSQVNETVPSLDYGALGVRTKLNNSSLITSDAIQTMPLDNPSLHHYEETICGNISNIILRNGYKLGCQGRQLHEKSFSDQTNFLEADIRDNEHNIEDASVPTGRNAYRTILNPNEGNNRCKDMSVNQVVHGGRNALVNSFIMQINAYIEQHKYRDDIVYFETMLAWGFRFPHPWLQNKSYFQHLHVCPTCLQYVAVPSPNSADYLLEDSAYRSGERRIIVTGYGENGVSEHHNSTIAINDETQILRFEKLKENQEEDGWVVMCSTISTIVSPRQINSDSVITSELSSYNEKQASGDKESAFSDIKQMESNIDATEPKGAKEVDQRHSNNASNYSKLSLNEKNWKSHGTQKSLLKEVKKSSPLLTDTANSIPPYFVCKGACLYCWQFIIIPPLCFNWSGVICSPP